MSASFSVNDLPSAGAPRCGSLSVQLGAALLALALAALPVGTTLAQLVKDLPKGEGLDQPPPADVSAEDLRNSIEPAITVINRENHDIEEYRSGNNLYMVKVKPHNLPPYYLVDQDGSGSMQWRRGPAERIAVPRWTILKW